MPLRASLARSLQYAMANMADIKTPLCALQPTPAIPHTASRSGAGTRGGSAGSSGRRRGMERASRQPPARRQRASPASSASPAPPGRLAPPCALLGRAKVRRALGFPRALERLPPRAARMLGPASRARAPVTAELAARGERSAVREVQELGNKNAREITSLLLSQTNFEL